MRAAAHGLSIVALGPTGLGEPSYDKGSTFEPKLNHGIGGGYSTMATNQMPQEPLTIFGSDELVTMIWLDIA